MKDPIESPAAGAGKRKGDEVAPGTPQSGEAICPSCGGSGVRENEACPDCGGSGKITALVGDA